MSERAIFLYDEHLQQSSTTVRILNGKDNSEIMRSFFISDFHMVISNQWSTGDSSMVKQLVDSVAGTFQGRGGKMLTNIMQNTFNRFTGDLEEGDAGYKIKQNVNGFLDTVQEYQNAKIMTADDFFKTFKGSNVTFPLSLSMTLISDEFNPNPSDDIYVRLMKLINVSLGDYESVFSDFIGVQHAPNGFKTAGFNISTEEKLDGALTIYYGDQGRGGFRLTNMLISNVHVTFSKTKVNIGNRGWRPLYLDVNIMLEPGRKFTKRDVLSNLQVSEEISNDEKLNFTKSNGRDSKSETENQIKNTRELNYTQRQVLKKKVQANIDQWFSNNPDFNLKSPVKFEISKDGNLSIFATGETLEDDLKIREALQGFKTSPGIEDSINKIRLTTLSNN